MSEALLQQLLLQLQNTTAPMQGNTAPTPAPTVETPHDTYNISTLELDKMLMMCGLKPGEYDMMPEWLKQ
eukprot:14780726-Ditylum_brightwellii.AAC.1